MWREQKCKELAARAASKFFLFGVGVCVCVRHQAGAMLGGMPWCRGALGRVLLEHSSIGLGSTSAMGHGASSL